ncbi:MAG TPA: site-2 protease family protein [Bacteroidota bacterium]
MTYENPDPQSTTDRPVPFNPRIVINPLLLLATFFTTTVAGVGWVGRDYFALDNFAYGLEYSLAILFVLGSHEFGHYFAARFHGVKTTLPFFIPFPPLPFFLNFGTLGAVIRTRSVVPSRKAMFDIGVAGPIAGFVACLIVLAYGFYTLPGSEYILSIHPHFDFNLNTDPTSQGIPLEFGSTLLYSTLQGLLTNPDVQFVPPMSEMYHFPFLCVGWFGLFVTAMNLIPIGQFDGGHILYTMLGEKHRAIAKFSFITLLILGLPSVLDSLIRMFMVYFDNASQSSVIPLAEYSWGGWFLWALISYFVVKLYHPPVPDETPLDEKRMLVGWFSVVIFVVCFSFAPFTIPL